MKNIHLMPTDKPSKLHLWTDENGTRLETCELKYSNTRNTQHIYITSDEEIKEGDWFYSVRELIEKSIINYPKGEHFGKVILTTDQDLMKDGVQDIDDEFLEWYVQNPSCEEVKIESWQTKGEWDLDYKIIIPSIGINSLNKGD